jgi:hypothetical protein
MQETAGEASVVRVDRERSSTPTRPATVAPCLLTPPKTAGKPSPANAVAKATCLVQVPGLGWVNPPVVEELVHRQCVEDMVLAELRVRVSPACTSMCAGQASIFDGVIAQLDH